MNNHEFNLEVMEAIRPERESIAKKITDILIDKDEHFFPNVDHLTSLVLGNLFLDLKMDIHTNIMKHNIELRKKEREQVKVIG